MNRKISALGTKVFIYIIYLAQSLLVEVKKNKNRLSEELETTVASLLCPKLMGRAIPDI